MKKDYDLVILGGGPGGYTAAIRAAQLGLKVAIVEKEKLGGTCLHRGCIPSKSLLHSAQMYRQIQQSGQYGVYIEGGVQLNYKKIQERKNEIISNLHKGVQALMQKGAIDVFYGTGRILGSSIFSPLPGAISITYKDARENTILVPKYVMIATGSKPKEIDGLPIDGTYIIDSDIGLEMESLPSSITIVGAGVIGIEWASMLNDFGVSVTVIEYADQILPQEDEAIAKEMEKALRSRGVKIYTNSEVLPDTLIKNKDIKFDIVVNDEKKSIQTEKMMIAIGRIPQIEDIGLNNTEIVVENGNIITNEFYQTKEAHIYAIGDCIGGMQLAHVASKEGQIAVEHITNKHPFPLDETHVPRCIYSYPEIASIGLTEKQAKLKGYDVKLGTFSFQNNGKALIEGQANGFVKILTDNNTSDLLGVHMIGPNVTNLISEAGLAKLLDATPWEISQSIHPHPSLQEVIGEAALNIEGKQIHS